MEALSAATYAFLVAAGFLAGFVDSIAGGGGIITIPALLAAGLPAPLALGTNKLQSSFGSLTATLSYRSSGLVRLRHTLPGIAFTAVGAALGTAAIQRLAPDLLERALPLVLVAVFIYLLVSPRVGEGAARPRLPRLAFYALCGLGIGFYDGFIGPGTGSFWALAFVALLGLDLRRATAHTKVMNFTSNIVSLAVFALGGKVLLLPGLAMGAGEVLGASLGSRLVIARGVRFVRLFFLAVVAATLARVLWRSYFA
ncbi:hypothetical protein FJ251_11660 [bacterium]|nr:hypothetical protein [bacterium]